MSLNIRKGDMYKFIDLLGIPLKESVCTIAAIAT